MKNYGGLGGCYLLGSITPSAISIIRQISETQLHLIIVKYKSTGQFSLGISQLPSPKKQTCPTSSSFRNVRWKNRLDTARFMHIRIFVGVINWSHHRIYSRIERILVFVINWRHRANDLLANKKWVTLQLLSSSFCFWWAVFQSSFDHRKRLTVNFICLIFLPALDPHS